MAVLFSERKRDAVMSGESYDAKACSGVRERIIDSTVALLFSSKR